MLNVVPDETYVREEENTKVLYFQNNFLETEFETMKKRQSKCEVPFELRKRDVGDQRVRINVRGAFQRERCAVGAVLVVNIVRIVRHHQLGVCQLALLAGAAPRLVQRTKM